MHLKKIKPQEFKWKKCWGEVRSSVDWRHFGTERRPHTWHHAKGSEEWGVVEEGRVEWQRAEFMQSDAGMTERWGGGKKKEHLTNVEEKASLPSR